MVCINKCFCTLEKEKNKTHTHSLSPHSWIHLSCLGFVGHSFIRTESR